MYFFCFWRNFFYKKIVLIFIHVIVHLFSRKEPNPKTSYKEKNIINDKIDDTLLLKNIF